MKNIFVLLVVLSCVSYGSIEGIQQKNRVRTQVNVQSERQLLLNRCHEIRARVNERFASAYHSSGRINSIKMEITNYLNSVRTITARQLLSELQANDFRDFI